MTEHHSSQHLHPLKRLNLSSVNRLMSLAASLCLKYGILLESATVDFFVMFPYLSVGFEPFLEKCKMIDR